MQQALKGLKEDKSSLILPADKGRASVVLDNHDEMKILIDSLSHTDNWLKSEVATWRSPYIIRSGP